MSHFRAEIDRMTGYAPGEQPQVGKFIKLNTNENPYRCSPAVNRAIQTVLERGLERYSDSMATAFRERAADVLGVGPDWIMAANGSDEILTIVTRAFVGEGQRIRLPFPSYILYKTLAEIQGAQSEEVHFRRDWTLGDDFSQAAADLRLVFLPNPNSPSGTVLSPARVLEIAQRLPCPLLVDEAYVDFAETSCLDLVKQTDKVLISRTFSKSYALAGLRFGFVVAQPHVIAGLVKLKDSYNCDALSIAGAVAAIDDQRWLAETRGKIIATRERMTRALRELGFDAVDSQANFVWCPHPQVPVKPLYERLKENRVLVRYMHYAGWGDGLRISIGADDQVDACLALLKGMI
ncbi:MAG: histidinol-phosphate transaminase [Pirellulales bacterium]|nr:histidinol-phosphate transaminase [Pirellulales bacterium]